MNRCVQTLEWSSLIFSSAVFGKKNPEVLLQPLHRRQRRAKTVISLLLTHYQTTNFRVFQTERVCGRQFQTPQQWNKVIQMGRKHWEKEKLLVTSNFSFSHSVLKRLVFQGRPKVSLCGNGLMKILTTRNPYVFTIHRATYTIKGDNSKCIFFFRITPLFQTKTSSSIKHPIAERWHTHEVLLFFVWYGVTRPHRILGVWSQQIFSG